LVKIKERYSRGWKELRSEQGPAAKDSGTLVALAIARALGRRKRFARGFGRVFFKA
jgi:hypothetical protein